MRMPQGAEWLIILLLIVLLFGAKRLPDAARGIGRSLRIFKAETKGMSEESGQDQATPPAPTPAVAPPAAAAAVAAPPPDAQPAPAPAPAQPVAAPAPAPQAAADPNPAVSADRAEG